MISQLKLKLLIIIILNKIYFYFILYLSDNVQNIQYKPMKHAILLLSSYGIDFLNNFLSQFNNDYRFDIFIHIDGKSKIDIEDKKTIIESNIKYINHLNKSKKFSVEMVDVMFELLNKASKTDNYDYFHYFSDSCYLIKTLDEFYEFFIRNNNISYMTYHLTRFFLCKKCPFKLFKGSQWMSLHRNIVHKLLDNINMLNMYKEGIKNKTIELLRGAPDEFIIQNLIVNDICKGNPLKKKVINNNFRFIRWKNCKYNYCPNYLDIDNVSQEEIKHIKKKGFLIIRKINYKNSKAVELINTLKNA